MRNDALQVSVWSPSRQGMAHSASGPSLASPTRVTRSRGACQIRVGEPQASPEPSPVPTPERASRRARPRVHWRSYLVLTVVALVALGALALSFGFGDNEGTALDAGGGVAFELRAGDGRFALSRGGAAVLRGWVEAAPAAAPSPPVAAVAAGDGCVELTAHAPVTFALEGSWYGGPEHSRGQWPVNGNRLARQRFVSADMLADREALGSVLEATWLTSAGGALVVEPNGGLELALNDDCGAARTAGARLCLWPPPGAPLRLTLCARDDVRAAHRWLLARLPRPSVAPSASLIRAPVWSTWARFKMEVDQPKVEAFAREIVAHDFPRSHMEIDDKWSTEYGDLEFDAAKFPDARAMTDLLHRLGFEVTLWVTPFAAPASAAYAEGARLGHWLRDERGDVRLVTWWQGEGALLDVESAAARAWFVGRLRALQASAGVDGFKFDAGEGSFVPLGVPGGLEYAGRWARMAAELGPAGEVRAAHASQDAGLWTREFDKDSSWSLHNGLRSLVTTALQFGVLGYPFVLPDMVGGNAYASDTSMAAAEEADAAQAANEGAADTTVRSSFFFGALPRRELFVRWCFANALLPAVQFSIAPWQYDEVGSVGGGSTTLACAKALRLREGRMPQLLAAAADAAATGAPIARPLWWHDPLDPTCHAVDDAFLLGNSTLVAPVLEAGVDGRAVYLPRGTWRDARGDTYEGPRWIHEYRVALDELAVFDLVGGS